MTTLRVSFIKTVAASNLNRDDTGAPKHQTFGGTERARLSSQCIKSATRKHMGEKVAKYPLTGIRTLSAPELIVDRAIELDASADRSSVRELVKVALGVKEPKKSTDGLKTAALFSITRPQITTAAKVVLDELSKSNDGKMSEKDVKMVAGPLKKLVNQALNEERAADQGLFGRFYASDQALTIDAASQVAHALGTCPMPEGSDYFTGRDELGGINKRDYTDESEGTEDAGNGAGHVGIKEFTSGPLYFYGTVDVESLRDVLDGDTDLTINAVVEFVDSFVRSLPTGSQNSYAAHPMPTTVLVEIADNGGGVSLAAAFERPSHTADDASRAMISYADKVHRGYGTTPDKAFLFSLTDDLNVPSWATSTESFSEVTDSLRSELVSRLGGDSDATDE